jgi:hypothetical protein
LIIASVAVVDAGGPPEIVVSAAAAAVEGSARALSRRSGRGLHLFMAATVSDHHPQAIGAYPRHRPQD